MHTALFRFFTLQILLCCIFIPYLGEKKSFFAHAESWKAQIHNAALPLRIVAVDKSKQQFYLYQKNTPLKLTHSYPCTTGQVAGDKQITNDKRTPEGIYFVNYKIDKGLDFKEYGGIAYTLNYPNPVDKLRGKTGYGIWIHSKGDGIKPRITRGCIAIGLDEIATVGPLLTSGTAVVVSESMDAETMPVKDDGTAEHLRRKMEQWTYAWANRSHSFFDFYNGEAYSKAMPETFKAFRANKERLFKRLKWINIFNKKVHVLEGPGYWVTWSEQFYRAPNLSTEGIRRLYWQKDADNVFRVVGMEWVRSDLGMQAAFEKGELVASTGKSTTDVSSAETMDEKPNAPDLSMPEQASQTPDVQAQSADAANTEKSTQTHVSLQENKLTSGVVSLDHAGNNAATTQPAPSIALTPDLIAHMQNNIDAWQKAWTERNATAFFAFYNPTLYGKTAGQNYDDAFDQLKNIMRSYFRSAWIEMLIADIKIHSQNNTLVTSMTQWIYMAGKKPREGKHTLYWQKNTAGAWRIVASEWKETKVSLQAAYLEKVSTQVDTAIEAWRKDWLSGDVEKYLTHYAQSARQGKRNKKEMAKQKEKIWQKAAPAKILLSGIRMHISPEGIKADMLQEYEDTKGKGDKGTKVLVLIPSNTGWKISKENWVEAR